MTKRTTSHRAFVNVTASDFDQRAFLTEAIRWYVQTYLGVHCKVRRVSRQIYVTDPTTGKQWRGEVPQWVSEAETIIKMAKAMSPEVKERIDLFTGFSFALMLDSRKGRA